MTPNYSTSLALSIKSVNWKTYGEESAMSPSKTKPAILNSRSGRRLPATFQAKNYAQQI